ncbi:ABC transporter permease subunit, partial [Escherichia sp. HC-CC]
TGAPHTGIANENRQRQHGEEGDNPDHRLHGINTDRVIALTFVIGAAMAAVAGVLLGQFYGVINPYIGFMAGMKAFTAAVLGGIGSIPGAMIGGLILG